MESLTTLNIRLLPDGGLAATMLFSALLIYRYLKRMGQDQLRSLQRSGRFSLPAFLARLSGRFRGPSGPPQ
jgi:hypothetical protein